MTTHPHTPPCAQRADRPVLATIGVLLLFTVLTGVCTETHALGLGDIQVHSRTGQPLNADIELLAADAADVGEIRATLASAQEFEWLGIPRPAVLDSLRFTPVVAADGRPVIRVTTPDPLNTPFLDFLIEVTWDNGHLIREYIIQPDPALPAPRRARSSNPAAAPAPQAKTAVSETTVPPVTTTERYVTRRGDTLFTLSRPLAQASGVPTREMALAIYQANSTAFIRNDMNRLKAGATLHVPHAGEVPELAAQGRATAEAARAADAPPPPARPVERPPEPLPELRETHRAPEPVTEPDTGGPQARNEAVTARPSLEIMTEEPETGEASGHGATDTLPELPEYLAQLQKTTQLAQELAESRRQEGITLKQQMERMNNVIDKQERLIELQTRQLDELRTRLASPAPAPPAAAPPVWNPVTLSLGIMSVVLLILLVYLAWMSRNRPAPPPAAATPSETAPAQTD